MRIFAAAILLASTPVLAGPSFVNVTGKCQIKVVPDRASLAFTAEP